MKRAAPLALVLAALAAINLPTAGGAPSVHADPDTGFTQGTWFGYLDLSGRVDVPDVGSGFTRGAGDFSVEALPADVSGEFSYQWTTEYHIDAPDVPDELRDGVGDGSITGSVQGDAGGTSLLVESMTVMGAPLDPSMALTPRLVITSSGCTMVFGEWKAEFLDAAAGAGVQLSAVDGTFVAQRWGDVPADLADQFRLENDAIVTDLRAVHDDLVAGDTSAIGRLPALLQRAEAVGRNRSVEEACLATPHTELVLQPIVDEFVRMYAAGEIVLDGPTVEELVIAALRAGVVGAAAVDPALAHARLLDLHDALARDIAATTDVAELTALDLAGRMLGFDDLLGDEFADD